MAYMRQDAAVDNFYKLADLFKKHDAGQLPGMDLLNKVREMTRNVTEDYDENGYYNGS